MDELDKLATYNQVLCEAQTNQKLLHELCQSDDGGELYTDAKIQCVSAQRKFSNLKVDYIGLLIKTKVLDYLENVPEDGWDSASTGVAEEFKVAHRDLRKAKQEVSDKENQLQELIGKANTAQEDLESKMQLLQSKMECIEQKRNKLIKLQAEHNERLGKVPDGITTNFEGGLAQQTEALQKAESMVTMYQNTIAGLKQEIGKLSRTKEATHSLLEESKPSLECLKAEREEEISKQQWMTTWCKNALEKLSHLSGIREHSIHGNKLTLELMSPGDSPVTGLLTLYFNQDQHMSSWQLHNAELNIESLDISDILQEAVRLNDVVFLVTQVKNRLYRHAPLRHEVEALRHRYALDWLSDEGLIRVMLGDKGQIVCSLTIESGYLVTGSIKLTAVEGLRTQIALDSLKPATEMPTITEWLDYLHEAINNG